MCQSMPRVEGNLRAIGSNTPSRHFSLKTVGHPGINGGCSAFSAALETSPIIRALPLGSLKDQKESLRVSNWQPSALRLTHHGPLVFTPFLYHPLARSAHPPGPAIKKTDAPSIQSQPAWGDQALYPGLCREDAGNSGRPGPLACLQDGAQVPLSSPF